LRRLVVTFIYRCRLEVGGRVKDSMGCPNQEINCKLSQEEGFIST
jgi:hypothetical protein